jgi:D-sedoheptulose 7-phosphate isomerase
MLEREIDLFIRETLTSAIAVQQAMLGDVSLQEKLANLAKRCVASLKKGGKIIFAGNGGSFADSQHLAAEFVSRLQFDRAPLPSVALSTNSSCMSAIGNDYGYDQVFSRELRALANREDIFIPITTSGNSPNILAAVEAANEIGVYSFAFTGKTGGKMASACPCLCVPAERTERIQEGHIILGHTLCAIVESAYFNR